MGRVCVIDGCANSHCARGFCQTHYVRWKRGKRGEELAAPKHAGKGPPTHGMSKTPEHAAWRNILRRCKNPRCKAYMDYGGRGIRVEFKSFEDFLAEVGQRPSDKYTLDRIDNDGNYAEGNIRWATRSQQQRNTRIQKNSRTGVKGVCCAQPRGEYRAYIYVFGKAIHVGYFNTMKEAVTARRYAELKYSPFM